MTSLAFCVVLRDVKLAVSRGQTVTSYLKYSHKAVVCHMK